MSDSDDDFAYLPPTLADIAREAGLPAALKLMNEKGGAKVTIPKRAPDDHWLVQLVGREAADRLGACFGGGAVIIPIGGKGAYQKFIAQRRRAVDAAVAQGRSINEIALANDMHARAVSRHKAALRQGSLSPGPLFGSLQPAADVPSGGQVKLPESKKA